MALNHVVLQGRLTADATLRYTKSEKPVASFTIAVDRGKDKGTDFIPCVAWNQTGLFVDSYFNKGDMILVEGRLTQRNYEDSHGNKRTAYEVVVSSVNFCGSKAKNDDKPVSEPVFLDMSEDESELPF